jgi:hypothetical protein
VHQARAVLELAAREPEDQAWRLRARAGPDCRAATPRASGGRDAMGGWIGGRAAWGAPDALSAEKAALRALAARHL